MICTRRQVLVGFFGLVAGGSLAARWALWKRPGAGPSRSSLPFAPHETETLLAAIEHALPGAVEAGVPEHMAWWMARDRSFQGLVREFQDGAAHLDRLAREFFGKVFAQLAGEQRDAIFRKLQAGAVRAPGFEGTRFFEHLVTFTLEGYLADPKYGGNRDQVGWRFIGFKPCWWSARSAPTSSGNAGHDHAHMGH